MNSKTIRRLAGDHGSLHTAGLPPNYLFPSNIDPSADLTSLDVLLCGPVGTPYAHGVWRLHLDIPPTYPAAAPVAFFRTRCWHPNVDEDTGAVCVETLKRDWSSTLKLRDVLVTISCLLIQPNPASALNEEAGKLANEDWAGFCRRAKLMTEIHATVPSGLAKEVREAQMRGEEKAADSAEKEPRLETQVKGKERVKLTPPTSSKTQRPPLIEDEENKQHRGRTGQSESDESDWIPRLTRSPVKAPDSKYERNKLGVRGLDPIVAVEDEAKRTLLMDSQSGGPVVPEPEDIDPSSIVTSKLTTHAQTSLVISVSPHITTSRHTTTTTPELLKYSNKKSHSVTQPNNPQHPLLKELSHTWRDSEFEFGNDLACNVDGRDVSRKRLAGKDFERKREWELKRFQKAGCDLKRFNRGDFGARTGIGRL